MDVNGIVHDQQETVSMSPNSMLEQDILEFEAFIIGLNPNLMGDSYLDDHVITHGASSSLSAISDQAMLDEVPIFQSNTSENLVNTQPSLTVEPSSTSAISNQLDSTAYSSTDDKVSSQNSQIPFEPFILNPDQQSINDVYPLISNDSFSNTFECPSQQHIPSSSVGAILSAKNNTLPNNVGPAEGVLSMHHGMNYFSQSADLAVNIDHQKISVPAQEFSKLPPVSHRKDCRYQQNQLQEATQFTYLASGYNPTIGNSNVDPVSHDLPLQILSDNTHASPQLHKGVSSNNMHPYRSYYNNRNETVDDATRYQQGQLQKPSPIKYQQRQNQKPSPSTFSTTAHNSTIIYSNGDAVPHGLPPQVSSDNIRRFPQPHNQFSSNNMNVISQLQNNQSSFNNVHAFPQLYAKSQFGGYNMGSVVNHIYAPPLFYRQMPSHINPNRLSSFPVLPPTNNPEVRQPAPNDGRTYRCPRCNTIFANPRSFGGHLSAYSKKSHSAAVGEGHSSITNISADGRASSKKVGIKRKARKLGSKIKDSSTGTVVDAPQPKIPRSEPKKEEDRQ